MSFPPMFSLSPTYSTENMSLTYLFFVFYVYIFYPFFSAFISKGPAACETFCFLSVHQEGWEICISPALRKSAMGLPQRYCGSIPDHHT